MPRSARPVTRDLSPRTYTPSFVARLSAGQQQAIAGLQSAIDRCDCAAREARKARDELAAMIEMLDQLFATAESCALQAAKQAPCHMTWQASSDYTGAAVRTLQKHAKEGRLKVSYALGPASPRIARDELDRFMAGEERPMETLPAAG